MDTYIAKVVGKIEYPPYSDANGNLTKVWNGLRVGVFRLNNGHEEQVGEYQRNHPSLYNTFFHFMKDGKDYALYSPHYTATRIMELPTCRDIGGEEPDISFCPLDYYVPYFIDLETYNELTGKSEIERKNEPLPENLAPYTTNQTLHDGTPYQIHWTPRKQRHYHSIGFVKGVFWGDSGSSKLQYLDLLEVDKGIIKRDRRIGDIELPDWMSLKEAIRMDEYQTDPDDPDDTANHVISVAVQQRFYLPDLRPTE